MKSLGAWLWLSTAIVVLLGLLAVGPTPMLLLSLLHVPAVLATLLLGRAVWCRLRGRSWALQWRGRSVLGGAAGWLAPLGYLLLWTVVREVGLLSANLYWSQHRHTTGWNAAAWREPDGDWEASSGRFAIAGVDGAFGEAFCRAIPSSWHVQGGLVTGTVRVEYEPPKWSWPLYKSAPLASRVQIDLRLDAEEASATAPPLRTTSVQLEVDGELQMLGFVSRREWHSQLGDRLGRQVRDAIDGQIKKLVAK